MGLPDRTQKFTSYPEFYARYGTRLFSPGQAPNWKVIEVEYSQDRLVIMIFSKQRTELLQVIVDNVSRSDYDDFYDDVYKIWWRYHLQKFELGVK